MLVSVVYLVKRDYKVFMVRALSHQHDIKAVIVIRDLGCFKNTIIIIIFVLFHKRDFCDRTIFSPSLPQSVSELLITFGKFSVKCNKK